MLIVVIKIYNVIYNEVLLYRDTLIFYCAICYNFLNTVHGKFWSGKTFG